MRLLYVLSQFSRGGAENHVASLVADQVQRGNEVLVLGLREGLNHPDKFEALLRENGAATSLPKPLFQRRLSSPALLWWLDRQIRDFNPDLIHTHLPRADIAVAACTSLRPNRLPVVSTLHGWEPRYARLVNRWLLKLTYNRATGLIAVSDWLKNETIRLGVRDRRFWVVHHGTVGRELRPGEAERIRSDLSVEFGREDLLIVGTVARLAVQKGIDVLLRAVSGLPHNFVVVILGSDEGEADNLLNLARELGVSARCRFVGHQEDVSEWIRAFDIFALPSRWEGFGLVLLEAGECGVPIVATDIPPINAIIRNDLDGLLVPVDDHEALGQAILLLGSKQELSDRLQESFSIRIESEFSEATMMDSVNSVYSEILNYSEDSTGI